MKRIRVAAGILRDAAGQVLITERLCEGPWNGLWEFPGGKIDNGEAASVALARELREELGIEATAFEPFMRLSHEYSDRHVQLDFFVVHAWNGEPESREGQGLRWIAVADLDPDELLPADAPLIPALREL